MSYLTIDQVRAAARAVTEGVATAPLAAGIALVAADTGRVLMIQRALIDGEDAGGKWEFPGGKLDEGETPEIAAQREFAEEVGLYPPPVEVVATWLSANGVYQLFVAVMEREEDLPILDRSPDQRQVEDPDNAEGNYTEAVAWFDPYDLDRGPRILREECRCTPWSLIKGRGPKEDIVAAMGTVELKVIPKIDWTKVDGRLLSYLQAAGAIAEPEPQPDFDSLVASLQGDIYDALLPEHELEGPTPYQISEDRLTADGHLALWASCHIGYPGCVKPPRESSFDFYNLTPARSRGQEIGVGRVTVGTGHAGGGLNWRTAAAHYDNSGTVVAVAHAVPDRWGIRLPSVIVASGQPEKVDELERSPISGDWRKINGRLRLVASLGVNVPGYPVVSALVAGGQVQSMFAGFDLRDVADLQLEADELAAELGLDPASRAEALRASLLAS